MLMNFFIWDDGRMVTEPVKGHINACNYFSHFRLFSGCQFTCFLESVNECRD